MKPLGVYFLLDTSASMVGMPLQIMNEAYTYVGRNLMRHATRQLVFSVLCYESHVLEVCRSQAQPPALMPMMPAGTSHLGDALARVRGWLAQDAKMTAHSLIVVVADDVGNDNWRAESRKLSGFGAHMTMIIIACTQKHHLHQLYRSARVFSLTDTSALEAWFKQFMGQRF